MSCIRGKLSDRVGNNVILSPEGAVLMAFPGTESSNPPHSLNDSKRKKKMAKSVFEPIIYCCGVSNDDSHSLVSRRGRDVHCIVGVLGKSSHTL